MIRVDDIDLPEGPCPPAPPHHVPSVFCSYGSVSGDPPQWLPCDCEDPADPWSPRAATDGPRECYCSHCFVKPRRDRGRPPCEYADHHCDSCHEVGHCTSLGCRP